MAILLFALVLFFMVFIRTILLLAAVKITKNDATFGGMLLLAVIQTLIGLIPGPIGWILGLIVTLFLLTKWTSASLWPDAVLITIITGGLSLLFYSLLTGLVIAAG